MTNDIKKGAPQCGLYLILPDNWMVPEFLTQLKGMFRAINASPYEKNAHVIELRLNESPKTKDGLEIVHAMCQLTKSQGVVFVVANDMALAKAIGADGVMLDTINDVMRARAMLGDDAIIGLRCGTSRRMAASAIEDGADYVSFFDGVRGHIDPAIVQWWRLKTDNPCLVEGNITANDCAFYVDAGVDFIDSGHYVWNHPDGVMQGIVNMMDAINETLNGRVRKYN
jgi:thiamine monophosphate synthase